MANDVPDWTGQQLAQLVSVSGQLLGDVASPRLSRDQARIVVNPDPGPVTIDVAVMASFKPAAGAVIAQVGNAGAFLTGTNIAVSPLFGQATSAGNFLLAWVDSDSADPTTAAAGWVQVVKFRASTGLCSALWKRENCGAAEAPPVFTAAGGLGPMTAQLVEYSGVLAAAATDQTVSVQQTGGPLTPTAPLADVDFGDLLAFGSHWGWATLAIVAFTETVNNNAAVIHIGDDGASFANHHASHAYAIIPAASRALPLGVATWPYDAIGHSAPGTGAQATVTLPAVAGKGYIIDHISASITNNGSAATQRELEILDGAAIIWRVRFAVSATLGDGAVFSERGLGIPITVGAAVTVDWDALFAGLVERVNVGAYLR